MIVLCLDTCLGACSCAIAQDGDLLGERIELMARGHQERLAPMIGDLASDLGIGFACIDRIAVTTGPGSFTGLRVGLAFAKGLSLALDRPCVGVGVLEALAASVCAPGSIASIIDAGRGGIYLQTFAGGMPSSEAQILPLALAAEQLARRQDAADLTLVGPGAAALCDFPPAFARIELVAPSPAAVAKLGAKAAVARPQPIYLRPPDAVRPA